jgi:hypothetical protein
MESYAMTGRDPPELIVKFWPPSVTAKGIPAINAIRRPLAFAVYARPFVAAAVGLVLVLSGNEYAAWTFRWLRRLLGM